jgi:hypothetical protein
MPFIVFRAQDVTVTFYSIQNAFNSNRAQYQEAASPNRRPVEYRGPGRRARWHGPAEGFSKADQVLVSKRYIHLLGHVDPGQAISADHFSLVADTVGITIILFLEG